MKDLFLSPDPVNHLLATSLTIETGDWKRWWEGLCEAIRHKLLNLDPLHYIWMSNHPPMIDLNLMTIKPFGEVCTRLEVGFSISDKLILQPGVNNQSFDSMLFRQMSLAFMYTRKSVFLHMGIGIELVDKVMTSQASNMSMNQQLNYMTLGIIMPNQTSVQDVTVYKQKGCLEYTKDDAPEIDADMIEIKMLLMQKGFPPNSEENIEYDDALATLKGRMIGRLAQDSGTMMKRLRYDNDIQKPENWLETMMEERYKLLKDEG